MLNGGDFRLDGGAMHGVVPKTIWSKLVSCDELNRVEYATNCLLVDTPSGERVLVETGNGDKLSAKERAIYGIQHDGSIVKALAEADVAPESIDLVVLTHLHFDHVGGAVRRGPHGLEPVFPRARHIVQRRELEEALHPHERNRASYLQDNIGPLVERGLLELVDGEAEVATGVRVVPTPGHTSGHQSVLVDGGAEKALFLGDVVPTSVHVKLPFIMAYDLDVVGTLESKRRVLGRAVDGEWLVLFGHDRRHGARLGRDDHGAPKVRELCDL
jgi:glyoxylase-like metal-dependent hydrolase (beta-lactamase superfamily II)